MPVDSRPEAVLLTVCSDNAMHDSSARTVFKYFLYGAALADDKRVPISVPAGEMVCDCSDRSGVDVLTRAITDPRSLTM